MTENQVKEKIVNRLHERCGICSFCGKQCCAHPNTNLPSTLLQGDVLWAINLDNYFESETVEGTSG